VLDQYIGVAMANLEARMNEETITHMPSTRPANCRPGNPRGLASAKAPIPASASPCLDRRGSWRLGCFAALQLPAQCPQGVVEP
jgi:hypothetical protein